MTDHIGDVNEKVVDLDKLEALAKAATPGPWITETGFDTVWVGPSKANAAKVARIICPVDVGPGYRTEYVDQQKSNAAYLAAANPATILDLIASARRDAALMSKVHAMATEGHVKAGCDNWRAVERCRQIANLTTRAAHTGEG